MRIWQPLKEIGAQMTPSIWYAEPLEKQDACVLLDQLQQLQQKAYLQQTTCLYYSLQAMITKYWISGCAVNPVSLEYKSLLRTSSTKLEQSLIELVVGQLLISNKINGAMEHLFRGFALAEKFLDAEEYFSIHEKIEMLGYLRLSDTLMPAQDLHSLLKEAAVIYQLEKRVDTKHITHKHPFQQSPVDQEADSSNKHSDTLS